MRSKLRSNFRRVRPGHWRLPALVWPAVLAWMLLATVPGAAGSASDAGGIVPAQFSTNSYGAAQFQVPIRVAPGIHGLQPSLSLVYNSQNNANGVVGIGWAAGGLSTIHRCGQTVAIEANVTGVENNRADRLCLDSTRLVGRREVRRDADYWDNNTFSKEVEDWAETIPSGSCGNAPCEFQTRFADGRVAFYGSTPDSQVYTIAATDGARQIRQWLISEMRDQNGNAIYFRYRDGGPGHRVIDRIDYGGHSVVFEYEGRNNVRDVIPFYDGTDYTALTVRLRLIRISTNGGEFKQYRLSYGNSALSSRSRLQKIEECDDAGRCLDPIEFTWNEAGSPNGVFRAVKPAGSEYQDLLRYDPGANIIPGDFNGDGKSDFIRQERAGRDNDTVDSFQVYFSDGQGGFNVVTPSGTIYQDHLRADPGANIIPGDFNGDGKTDFIRQERGSWDGDNTSSFRVYFSRGDGYFNMVEPGQNREDDPYQHHLRADPGANIIPGDFNGDGKTDFLRQERGDWDNDNKMTFAVYLSYGDGTFQIIRPGQDRSDDPYQHLLRADPGAILIPGDYNGDGRTDFIRQERGDWAKNDTGTFKVYFSNGNGTFRVVMPGGEEFQKDLNARKGAVITPADVNGDGKTDFLAQGAYIWDPPGDRTFFRVYISRGDGQFDIKSNWRQGYKHNGWLQSEWARLIPADYNGDGKMDFLRQEVGDKAKDEVESFQVYISRGDGFFDLREPGGWDYVAGLRDNSSGGANIHTGDFDGDGRTDFLRQEKGQWDDDTSNSFGVFFADASGTAPAENIAVISQGSVVHEFEYRRLSQYDANSGMSYPATYGPAGSPLPVLYGYRRSLITGSANGAFTQTIERTYEFRGAASQHIARGFSGFQEVRVTAPQEEFQSTTSYHVSFPLTGQQRYSEMRSLSGTLLSTSAHTFDAGRGASAQSYFPRMIGRGESKFLGAAAQTSRADLHYDSLGNPILITDNDGGRTLYTCSSFDNDYASSRPGSVTGRVQATSCSVSGNTCSCSGVLTESRMIYDASGNVREIKAYDSSRDDWLTVTYTYDSYGNRVRAERPSGAVAEIEYDPAYHTYPERITTRAGDVTFVEERSYDARHGQWTLERDANGAEVRRHFDAFGRLSSVQRSAPEGGLVTTETHAYARESDGLFSRTSMLAQSRDGSRSLLRKSYFDSLGRELKTVAGSGADAIVEIKEYGVRDEVLRQSNSHRASGSAQWTELRYNDHRDVREILSPGGARSVRTYAVGGGPCASHQLRTVNQVHGGKGRHSVRCENARNKTERLVLTDPTDNRSTTQVYSFDALDRLVGSDDGRSQTQIELDSLGRQVRVVDADRGTTQFVYDERGLLKYEIQNGAAKEFHFDELNRERRIDYADGSYALFEYDDASIRGARGRLTAATMFGSGNTQTSRREYAYDLDGNPTVVSLSIHNGGTYRMMYRNDFQGRPVEITYPGGSKACYQYDAHGLLQDIRMSDDDCDDAHNDSGALIVAAYSDYTAEGQPRRVEYGNGVVSEFEFDALSRVSASQTAGQADEGGTAVFLDRQYSWTPLGEIVAVVDRAGDKSAAFEYDGFGYLTRASGAYGDLTYEHDASGNLRRKDSLTLTYEGNRPVGGDNGLVLAYDDHGNVIYRRNAAGDVFDIRYNGMHKIREVLKNGVRAGTYEYDAGGQRVRKIDGHGIETIYINAHLEFTRYPDGQSLVTEYVQSPAGRIAAFTHDGAGVIEGSVAQINATSHALQAQSYNTSSVGGLIGWLHHGAAAVLVDPAHAAVAGFLWSVLMALIVAAVSTAVIVRLFTAAGRSAYARRRRRLLLPMPALLPAVFALSVQCGNGGGDDMMLMPGGPAGSEMFAPDTELGPGHNGYGYPQVGSYYFQQDQVGSTSLVTNLEGKLVACTVYKPYGEVHQDVSEGRDIYRSKFNGNEWDRDGEMYYFNARYYDPTIGRFLQADDLLFGTDGDHAAALNRYAFAGNNPATYYDPGGRFFPLIGLGILMFASAKLAAAAAVAVGSYAAAAAASAAAAYAVVAATTIGSIAIAAGQMALVGALIGAVSYGVELGVSGDDFDGRKFGAAVGIGALAGIIGGGVAKGVLAISRGFSFLGMALSGSHAVSATGMSIAANVTYGLSFVLGGATQAFVNASLGQLAGKGEIDWARAGIQTGIGGALGGLGLAGGKLAGYAGSRFTGAYPKSAASIQGFGNRLLGGISKRLPEGITAEAWLSASGKLASKIGTKGSIFGGSLGGYESGD